MRRIFGWTALIAGILLILLLVLRTPDTDPQAMRAKYGGQLSRFIDVGGGLNVHLRDTGPRDAPVLMLLHGANASLHTWEPWAERLGKHYRIIRFDLPGHGLTGPSPTRQYSTAALAAVVEQVRAKLGVDRLALAGSSMGGGVAWQYALIYPQHLTGLILVDAAGQPQRGDRSLPLAFRLLQTPVLRNLATTITPRFLIEDGVAHAFYDQSKVTPAMIDRAWKLLRYPGNRQAMIDRASLPPETASPGRLHAIKVPTLILWGADDAMIPVRSAYWFAQNIPGSQLIIYPQTGHAPMEERADRSAADVAAFLAAHESARHVALPRSFA